VGDRISAIWVVRLHPEGSGLVPLEIKVEQMTFGIEFSLKSWRLEWKKWKRGYHAFVGPLTFTVFW
jgi:hypothetical protein